MFNRWILFDKLFDLSYWTINRDLAYSQNIDSPESFILPFFSRKVRTVTLSEGGYVLSRREKVHRQIYGINGTNEHEKQNEMKQSNKTCIYINFQHM